MFEMEPKYIVKDKKIYGPDSELREANWQFYAKRSTPVTDKMTIGLKSSLVTYRYNSNVNLATDRSERYPQFEMGRAQIILGEAGHENWDRSIGIEFLDIGDTGTVDEIELGGRFFQIGIHFGPKHPHCRFYKGSQYLERHLEINEWDREHYKADSPEIQEAGYWSKKNAKLRLVPSENISVGNMFRVADVFYGALRNRVRNNPQGLEPISSLESEARGFVNGILDANLPALYIENTR